MAGTALARAAAVAGAAIVLLLAVIFYVAGVVSSLLGLPPSPGLPSVVRALGAVLAVAGLAVAGWVFRYRSPADMIVSTYVTFMKLFRRTPLAERSDRAEPLVVAGPQRYVRNPLYFAVIVVALGWGLAGASTSVLIGAALLFAWFRFFLIPFEERELRVLFGEQYGEYANRVPALFPFTKRKR